MRFGYFLSCEEYDPHELLHQARLAEQAGFEALWISDHFHPWNDAQGQSAFVWSMIGALSQVCELPVTTAVTCPTVRLHPANIAQAAATSAVLLDGRFILGLGTGEALNEHITGEVWPSLEVRLEMLEEAVHVIRRLWEEDGFVNHRGRYYTVDTARIYTKPEQPPPIYVSGLAPKSTQAAGRIADGYISTSPDSELLDLFRRSAGRAKPAQAGVKVCYADDADTGAEVAHSLWANSGIPGELGQVLPSPRHFEQASQLVSRQMMRENVACGPDPAEHLRRLQPYADAGFDELYVANMGPHYADCIQMYGDQILPELRDARRTSG